MPEWVSKMFSGLGYIIVALVLLGVSFIVFLALVKIGLAIWGL